MSLLLHHTARRKASGFILHPRDAVPVQQAGQQQEETMWDCLKCGVKAIAASIEHCPVCSHPKDAPPEPAQVAAPAAGTGGGSAPAVPAPVVTPGETVTQDVPAGNDADPAPADEPPEE